ncbi:cell division protein FtsW [Luminiphilus syltensis NOR5-1B]|uniref:Probable peptidoglycan glycosyltransferase FtsW n=1 Tax=Luminiphilus syltensis NOR5-1B TaxID=565045 RepID=B8KR52_9GAMM|nr:putative lipid II flippase FtsW [Luminiphilus syltensis]EED36121.1 cell division protein FtsW [Luminiphilus syltensis NOR5-1B]
MNAITFSPARPDPLLSGLAITLIAVGLVAISSASIEYGDHYFDNPWHHTIRHSIYLVLAVAAAGVAYMVPTTFWQRTSPWWLLLGFALLILVLLPGIGRNVNGSQRWLPIGPLTVQPSEVAKFAVVLYLAGFLVRHQATVRSHWEGLAKPVGILAMVALLLLLEPDFGATVITTGTVFGMLFLAGARLIYVLGLVGVAVGALVVMVVSAPYRLQRLTAYTDPWADPYGSGFQLIQSLIAYGRGEWWGVGLGNSIQKLFYLPEAHTDFVFSIWAEETGLVGSTLVILVYALLVGRILHIGYTSIRLDDAFAAYVCYGIGLIFAGQAFVNMGVSSGLLPTKGLTLPLISYGGSSLIISCVMLAIVLRIEHNNRLSGGQSGKKRRAGSRRAAGRARA